ncbi:MAG: alpha/beta hydrolase [Cytophagaceae bacterium]|nr:alpha/beta hydrolase [Cytophagaceae bacterium]MDW8456557.1 alpha/beta hydrolase [Cytophagaceae bacterium]
MDKFLSHIEANGLCLHYSRYGNGEKILFCFHGFGMDKESFLPFENLFKNKYVLFCFDLPFHGMSYWKGNKQKPIMPADVQCVMQKILTEQSISRFSLFSFSMGARFAWTIIEQMPDKVEHAIFIAPDGISKNYWYKFATHNVVTRRLFKHTIHNTHLMSIVAGISQLIKLSHKTTVRFSKNQLARDDQRDRVYNTWIALRKLEPNKKKLIQLINTYNISMDFYFGKYDRIIPVNKMSPFIQKIKNKNIYLLNAGHSNLLKITKQEMEEKNRHENFF